MSQSASTRSKYVFIGIVGLIVVAVVAAVMWRMGDSDEAEPLVAPTRQTATPTPEATAATPTPEATTPTPSPTASGPTCEGPDTIFNEEGVEKDTLLPDCGVAPVSEPEREKSGLSLACGGLYPVILYKTTTTDAKTSICGTDSSGADFRFVTQPSGGAIMDLKGRYEPDLDAFVATQGDSTFTVQAYDGTLVVTKDGKKATQKSSDWISLDNEPDSE